MRLVRNLIWLLILLPAPVWAQTAAQSVEVEPVTCWWRTSAASVRMGEPFGVVLTCSALESDAARAVIDRSRLGTASVQFPPYEVVGGAEGVDHVTTGRRFIQYEYTLRLVNENSFGVDVPIPEMAITYRIESRMADASAVQGREQSYLLPPLGIRIASLVPDSARHIREAAVPTLTAIAAREFRARMFRVVALILVSVAGLTLVVALLRWARQQRTGSTEAKTQLIPHRAVLVGVRQQLRALQQQTRAGWTVDHVRQGLAVTRVVAAYVADRPVGQRRADKAPADGELAIAGGWLPRRRILVGGATTAAGLDHVTARTDVDGLRGALQTLTAARYGRDEGLDDGRLDAALAAAVTSAARVAARYTVAAEAVTALRRTVLGWRPRAWAR